MFPSFSVRVALVAFAVFLLESRVVAAPQTTFFGFDESLEGWTGSNGIPTAWRSSGGNPGGFAEFGDLGHQPGYALAPDAFLGDWSEYVGGSFLFDAIALHPMDGPGPMSVFLDSGPLSANWRGIEEPGYSWTHVEIPLVASAWGVSEAEWTTILGNVTGVRIKVDWSTAGTDLAGLDNIGIVPEPSAMLLLGIAGAILAGRRQISRGRM